MTQIAVLLTCFNRKQKTLSCLRHLFDAFDQVSDNIVMDIYLTDDGSSDGTAQSVQETYPSINILKGDGTLFWAGGMKNSWKAALRNNYDCYLLLNDDTNVFVNLFEEYLSVHKQCIDNFGQGGIYIGSTKEPDQEQLTYGGAKLLNRFTFKYEFIEPNGQVQDCELGNANIMFVSNAVINKIGILSDGYKHGVADYDYTLKATKKKLPVLVMPSFLGTCADDHSDIYETFATKTFKQRYKLLNSPLGLDFTSNFNLMLRHFPLRAPFVLSSAFFKLFFPNTYVNLSKKR